MRNNYVVYFFCYVKLYLVPTTFSISFNYILFKKNVLVIFLRNITKKIFFY